MKDFSIDEFELDIDYKAHVNYLKSKIDAAFK